jgi:hypothetical protein
VNSQRLFCSKKLVLNIGIKVSCIQIILYCIPGKCIFYSMSVIIEWTPVVCCILTSSTHQWGALIPLSSILNIEYTLCIMLQVPHLFCTYWGRKNDGCHTRLYISNLLSIDILEFFSWVLFSISFFVFIQIQTKRFNFLLKSVKEQTHTVWSKKKFMIESIA